ncbi:MAG TPA: hypothetical protein VGF90_07435, partial [Verrucomicrobiae bacterium]
RTWIENRKKWHMSNEPAEAPDSEPVGETLPLPTTPIAAKPTKPAATSHKPSAGTGDRIEIEPEEGDWGKILKTNE